GQGFEIHVPLPSGEIGDDYPSRAEAAFRAAYTERHRFSDADAEVEAVDWYLVATVETPKQTTSAAALAARAAGGQQRDAYFPDAGGWLPTRIVSRGDLVPGTSLPGPAIVEDPDSTVVVPPGDTIEVTPRGHLLIRIETKETP
ncbi:MAG: hypothetical protein VW835_15795, partial [Rickettsiales bacterium]